MKVDRIREEGLGNSTYLFGQDGSSEVFALDPPRDASALEQMAADSGKTILATLETHLHADFISGGPELLDRGARYFAPEGGKLRHPHVGVVGGETVELGELNAEVLETPGHTPEHVSYLVHDEKVPAALFSGGALMAGGSARTDLISPEMTEPLARALYKSLNDVLFNLPDDVEVYPTHGGGSFCSALPGTESLTTIGDEKRTHPAALAPDEDAFVEQLVAGYGTWPTYYSAMRRLNQDGLPLLRDLPSFAELSVGELISRNDAVVVDVRSIEKFAAGHIPGSMSIALRPEFVVWYGWLIALDRSVIFVLDESSDRTELLRQSHLIGHDAVLGELGGGVDAWSQAGEQLSHIQMMDPRETGDRLIIDVRQTDEYLAGHPTRSVGLELGRLGDQGDGFGNLSKGQPLATVCGHGERAMSAASILETAGFEDVAVVAGGVEAMRRSGIEME